MLWSSAMTVGDTIYLLLSIHNGAHAINLILMNVNRSSGYNKEG